MGAIYRIYESKNIYTDYRPGLVYTEYIGILLACIRNLRVVYTEYIMQ